MQGLPDIPNVQLVVDEGVGRLIENLEDHEQLAVQEHGKWFAGIGIE